MKKKVIFNFNKDERFSFLFSIQRTSNSRIDKWHEWYFSFLFWCFSILIIEKR
jgi:hypothetical protein